MKQQSKVFTTLVAWTPGLALTLTMCVPDVYRCIPINPGGNELMCSLDYAPAAIKFAVGIARVTGVVAFLAIIRLAMQRRLSGAEFGGLALSILLIIVGLSFKLFYGDDDYP